MFVVVFCRFDEIRDEDMVRAHGRLGAFFREWTTNQLRDNKARSLALFTTSRAHSSLFLPPVMLNTCVRAAARHYPASFNPQYNARRSCCRERAADERVPSTNATLHERAQQ